MQIDTNDMVSATEVNRNVSRLISEVGCGRMFIVMKDNVPTACIVGPQRLEELQRLEARIAELEEMERDMKLLALSLVRLSTDTGERFSLDDVVAELGIDEGDED